MHAGPHAVPSPDAPAGVDILPRLHRARLLLVAPHPDDESLATGGLIQHAVRAGARVHVVQVTDGDNNPWPQRWLERRLHIGPAERRRWGRCRSDEMLEAMRQLGLDASSRWRLGWPDLGVTRQLQTARSDAVERMADILRESAPDIVVMPSLGDCHPDHGACHVLVRLAMVHAGFRGACLVYQVHGPRPVAGQRVALCLDAAMREGKRRAILAHATQVALARGRLLARAGAEEVLYELPAATLGVRPASARIVPLPWRPSRLLWPWLELTLAHPDGVQAWKWRQAPLSTRDGVTCLALPPEAARGPLFAKLKLRCRSPWIFDHWGWHDLTAAATSREAVD